MHSIQNLIKLNEINEEKKKPLERMSLSELARSHSMTKNLLANKKLIMNLADKGSRLQAKLNQLEELIKVAEKLQKKSEEHSVEIKIVEAKPNKPFSNDDKSNIDNTASDMLKNLNLDLNTKNETKTNEIEEDNSKRNEIEPENYFAKPLTNKPAKKAQPKPKINPENYHLVKQKILANMNKKDIKITKMIPLEECFVLVKEHEQKIRELQMKQAAEKLIQGKSVNYDYSFLNKKSSDENLYKYRDKKPNDYLDNDEYDYYYNDDESDEYDDDNELVN